MAVAEAVPNTTQVGKPPELTMPARILDPTTMVGLILSFVLVAAAIAIGGSVGAFVNWPSVLLVIFGTVAVTAITVAPEDLGELGPQLGRAVLLESISHQALARNLVQVAEYSRRFGRVALENLLRPTEAYRPLNQALGIIVDGYGDAEVQNLLRRETSALIDQRVRAAGIFRRAADTAPAMGLIGTLVGLVQMLSQLDDPSKVGPGMAIALLTTFYGAVLGTVLFGPIAAKLERRAEDDAFAGEMIVIAAGSIARSENPRQLEMLLNGILPLDQRIRYFD